MTNTEIRQAALTQQAIDNSCAPGDFLRAENVVVISRASEGASRYADLPGFCTLTHFGTNIVASVDARIYAAVSRYLADAAFPHRFVTTPKLYELNAALRVHGYVMGYQAELWLPDANIYALPCEYETRVLFPDELSALAAPQWNNALSGADCPGSDVLGVGAYENGKLIGLAGCSNDCGTMWQVGIDVLPEYRLRGIASALTSRLAVEILGRGIVPYYSCCWANLGSVRNAIKSGFHPGWVRVSAREMKQK